MNWKLMLTESIATFTLTFYVVMLDFESSTGIRKTHQKRERLNASPLLMLPNTNQVYIVSYHLLTGSYSVLLHCLVYC